MKRGKSYIQISDSANPKHVLVKALVKKGYKDFELIYASHWATDAGWCCDGFKLPQWLGYTIAESIELIKKLPDNKNNQKTNP